MWRREPSPVELLQEVALGMVAVADKDALRQHPREVAVELLEDSFQSLSARKTMGKYKAILEGWDIPIKILQFSIMRMLCVIYRSVRLCAKLCY
jgi:hypothetical protein